MTLESFLQFDIAVNSLPACVSIERTAVQELTGAALGVKANINLEDALNKLPLSLVLLPEFFDAIKAIKFKIQALLYQDRTGSFVQLQYAVK